VIGHEVSHGFDDQGAKYDADGNLSNWWTEGDQARFKELGKALVAQYDSVEVLPGVTINGEFTLGENIGDLGGVFSAYDGLQMHLKEAGDPGDIDGFTQNQRFFITWSTIWRGLIRDEALKNRIKTDPHSPGQYRGFMPIMNMKAFQEAFDIKEGDKMYLGDDQRVQIW
jgi:predicted metalloendopeptidase